MTELSETDFSSQYLEWKQKHGLIHAGNNLEIREGEYAVSDTHTKVVDLANCLGVSFVGNGIVSAHIPPFGGENYGRVDEIRDWAKMYIKQLQDLNPQIEPTSILVRSREIGSRPLFHGQMINSLRDVYPEIKIDTFNGTELEVVV